MKCNSEVNLSKKRYSIRGVEDRYINAVNENRIFKLDYFLPNSAEFSAKILQDFCLSNEINGELLAKVLIMGATHNNSHTHAHHGLFQKY
ncbi:MAG: hypothetical protein KBG68_01935 [Prevotella sp.]|nr:hypothetical protein [Prevotella sp.]